MNQKLIDAAAAVIARRTMHSETAMTEGHSVLILRDLDGYPTGSTKSPTRVEGIERIYICDGLESNATKRVRECNLASICFNNAIPPEYYSITLTGKITIVTDPEVKRAMAYPGLTEYFPGGAEDPNYCVLMFETERYNIFFNGEQETGSL